jgi:Protein of unknown function (DUF433)
MDIVGAQQQGYTVEAMIEVYPSLNLAQVHAALSYFDQHTDEITVSFEEDRRIAEQIANDRAAFLSNRSSG